MEGCLKKSILLIFLVISLYQIAESETENKALKIVDEFPTESQMFKWNFALNNGSRFVFNSSSIYFCDQDENKIYEFDHKGNLIRIFGKKGQGPGDLNNPLNIAIFNNELYITDNFNARIQIWSLDGVYKRQIKIVSSFFNLIVVKGRIIISNPIGLTRAKEEKDKSNFEIYDMDGNLLKKVYDPFPGGKNIVLENDISVQTLEDEFHCLQNHGVEYRIYDSMGVRKKSIFLNYNPKNDREYIRTKYQYTYMCFFNYEGRIYAPIAWYGNLVIVVFDREGRHLFNYVKTMEDKNSIYSIADIKIIKKEKSYFYLLLRTPELKFIIAEL